MIDLKQIRHWVAEEVYTNGNVDALDAFCSKDFISHDPLIGALDLEGHKQNIRALRSAFPDLKLQILDVVTDGHEVATRWKMTGTHQGSLMGVEGSGRTVELTGATLSRVEEHRFVEDWVTYDTLSFFDQLGISPDQVRGRFRREVEAGR